MLKLVRSIVSVLARRFRSRAVLELENLALRQRLKDKRTAKLLASSAKGDPALNSAGARDQGTDFWQEFPTIHRFGQVVITACLKRALSVLGRRIRRYGNNRNPLPALLPTQILYQ